MTRPELDAPKRVRYAVLVPVFALIALLCWAVASPIGSSPDDDFHLSSIWCGLGDRPGVCQPDAGDPTKQKVPSTTVYSSRCFFGHATQSAQCQGANDGTDSNLVATNRGNFSNGAYPPVFYWFMSLFVGPNVAISALVMRLVNVVLFLALTALTYLFLPKARRQGVVWSWAVTTVPLGVFLIASNNPSAWAIISAGTLWLALVGYFESSGRRKIALGVLSTVALLMGAGSRADSAVYAVIAIGVAAILSVQLTRRHLLSAILPVAMVLGSIGFYLASRQSGLASGFTPSTEAVSLSRLLWNNFIELPQLWVGSLGTWPLGWLDTPMPAIVSAVSILCFGGVVFSGFRAVSARKLIALIVVAGALWAIPMWILLQSKAAVGDQVQPRYLLPLLIMLAGIALFQTGPKPITFTTIQVVVIAGGLSVANSIALHVNMQRYITGLGVNEFNLDAQIGWWWDTPFSPMVVWILGTLAFAAAVSMALLTVSGDKSSLVKTPVAL